MIEVVMANLMPNIFIAIGVASTVAFFGIPNIAFLLSHSLPDLWKSAVPGTVVPRYLFIAVNSIIIIVWKLHGVQHHHDDHHKSYNSSSSISSSLDSHHLLPSKLMDHANSSDLSDVFETNEIKQAIRFDNDKSSYPCPLPSDHPPPPLENDTMDALWKAIRGGGTFPDKNQNLKKSDTSAMLVRSSAVVGSRFVKSNTFRESVKTASQPSKEMRKSETFREYSSSSSSSPSPAAAAAPATGWRGRDQLVIGRDELFGKVEAFIKMNYDQLRLQRQESEQRYVEMVNEAY